MKRGLHAAFKMKDLGGAKQNSRIEIRRHHNDDIFLVQERYARDVIAHFNMDGCKSMSTPLELVLQLGTSQQPVTDEGRGEMIDAPYTLAIESLMFFVICTRLDLATVVSELRKFSENQGAAQWEGVK